LVSISVGLIVAVTGTAAEGVLVLVIAAGLFFWKTGEVVGVLVCLTGEGVADWQEANIKETAMIANIVEIGFILSAKQ